MPNLFSFLPVEIFACVPASTSGLMRNETGARLPALTARCVQNLELRLRFDVEAVDAGFQREIHFRRRLGDARKDDAVRRNAGGQRPAQFADGDHVDPGAEPRERLQDSLVGIRLHRVADHGVDAVERFGKDPVVAFEGCRRIDVEGRTDGLGDLRQGNVFGVEDAVAVLKMVHGLRPVKEADRGRNACPSLPAAASPG